MTDSVQPERVDREPQAVFTLSKRASALLIASFGVCCGSYCALLGIGGYAIVGGDYPENTRINLCFYLLTLLLGFAGAILALRSYPEVRHPLVAAVGLVGWWLGFNWAIRDALDVRENVLLTTFLPGAGLLVLDRAFATRDRAIALRPRRPALSAAKWVVMIVILVPLAGAYSLEYFARSRAREVYDHVLSVGGWSGVGLRQDWDRLQMNRKDIHTMLHEKFSLQPDSSDTEDRCTWRGALNTYEIVFTYSSREGRSGCKLVYSRVPRWSWLPLD